ncbi:hypothetical protein ST201phi2-1p311 [Pseudomonas phage 201phi2-1]|uniref:Uncharacterized protein n=1 Tax=Pseudomonas phage 201phi2-1 TaxID=198110 RepID=B3FJH1_BP201|nr:hypothetical protein ST201phi2-1p311 [Pseudomonas phage 201phi2-1]ABY63137.1 hypothetical protein 201phi2-1p311 [Pseudomonas phage 201phi2-1]
MGCDIHPNFEKRVTREDGTKVWEKIEEHKYEGNRHYFLFGWLANVRNGYGFAGGDTGDGIKPLALPRGLPTDIASYEPEPPINDDTNWNSPEYKVWEEWYERNDYGDHSQSWLTGEEIMKGLEEVGGTRKRGVLSLAQYTNWDRKSQPDRWCGAIFGRGCVTLSTDQANRLDPKVGKYIKGVTDDLTHVSKSGRWVNKRKMIEVRPNLDRWHYMYKVGGNYPKLEGETTEFKLVWDRQYKIKPSKAKHLRKLNKYADRIGNINVACQWTLDNKAVREEFAYFTDEVKRLMDLHGEIRMVFGFDS